MNANNNVELSDAAELQECPQRRSQSAEQRQETSEATGQSLLPFDGGKAAWKLLFSAFLFEALFWGTQLPAFLYTLLYLHRICRL